MHRATTLARCLPENGWQPYVLTVATRAHDKVDLKSKSPIPDTVKVYRAFALDARRHLSIRGRYTRWSALPDQWANWALSAVPIGWAAIVRNRIDVIFVTFPIATAVLIGLVLQKLTGKPLVVDFRDSMTEDNYPSHPGTRALWQWIEKSVIRRGARFVFTTESARRMYLKRYPQLRSENCIVIQNGFNEDDFTDIAASPHVRESEGPHRLRLVHAGLIYPEERDPSAFFRALKKLKTAGTIDASNLTIDLRASGSEKYYSTLLRDLNVDDIVHLLPALPHREALRDTAEANGLLLFQAASCNHQIPAKVYEYLRLGKPILALTSSAGDTAALLRQAGGTTIADLGDENSIFETMASFLDSVREGVHPLPSPQIVCQFDRKKQAAELARHLSELRSSGVVPQQASLQN